jgi:hypothetical protein
MSFAVDIAAPIFRYFPAPKPLSGLRKISGFSGPPAAFREADHTAIRETVTLREIKVIFGIDAIQGNHRPLRSRADFSRVARCRPTKMSAASLPAIARHTDIQFPTSRPLISRA